MRYFRDFVKKLLINCYWIHPVGNRYFIIRGPILSISGSFGIYIRCTLTIFFGRHISQSFIYILVLPQINSGMDNERNSGSSDDSLIFFYFVYICQVISYYWKGHLVNTENVFDSKKETGNQRMWECHILKFLFCVCWWFW